MIIKSNSEENTNASLYIIVLNYNGFEDTKRCIESLQKISYPHSEIIIVDNCSSDDSQSKLRLEFPDHIFLEAKHNKGFAAGMNIGIKYSLNKNADYVILLNNDTIVESDFADHLIESAERDKSIGMLSPKVAYLDTPSKIYCAGGEFSYFRCGGISKYQGKTFSEYGIKDREISMAEGCCILVKSKVFSKVGLLDENFFMYFEEVEFSMRVKEYFKIYYVHSSKIYHRSGAGKNWLGYSNLYNYYFTRNRFLLFKNARISLKIWVIVFSAIVTFLKIFNILAKNVFSFKNHNNKMNSIKILIKGYIDGFKIITGNMEPISNNYPSENN